MKNIVIPNGVALESGPEILVFILWSDDPAIDPTASLHELFESMAAIEALTPASGSGYQYGNLNWIVNLIETMPHIKCFRS